MMVARSGMFVAPLAGSPPVGMSPTDGRIAFSSLIGTTPQCASGGAITQSASTMAFTVASGVWQLPDVSNAAGTSNFLSAIDLIVLTPAAGPGTGSRIDLICAKQNNVENSDADSRSNLILVAGIAGAPGVAPAVPAGAYLHATVNVPTSAATASACTVVSARPTTYAPLPIKASTLALLNLVTGQTAQHATVTNDTTASNNGDYVFASGAWSQLVADTGWLSFTPTLTGVTIGNGALAGRYRQRGKSVEMYVSFTMGSTSAMSSGPTFSVPVTARTVYCLVAQSARYLKNGVSWYPGTLNLTSQTAVALECTYSSTSFVSGTQLNATSPFTWAANDGFFVGATYEAA